MKRTGNSAFPAHLPKNTPPKRDCKYTDKIQNSKRQTKFSSVSGGEAAVFLIIPDKNMYLWTVKSPNMQNNQTRLQALDVMRGIAIAAMIMFNNPGGSKVFAPLKHAVWNGLTPTDLAYPFFMFIMGVAMCFSMRKFAGCETRALGKIFRRAVLIFVLGVFLSNFSKLIGGKLTFDNLRIMGVLQRLGLVYLFGALVYLYVPKKAHLPIAAVLMAAYIIILKCFNGYVCSADNLLSRIDCIILGPGHMPTQAVSGGSFPFENQSLLGTLFCTAHVLLGSFAGRLILDNQDNPDRVRKLAVFGTVLLFAGFLLQYLDPINKKLWTSSYMLVTCGAASLLLALLIEIIDIKGWQKWGGFFKVFGTNAIVAYTLAGVCSPLLRTWGVKKYLYAEILKPVFGDYGGSLAYALIYIVFIFLLTLPLYRKKIFIRL